MNAKVSLPLSTGILLFAVISQKWYLALFAAPLLLQLAAGLGSGSERAESVKVERAIEVRRFHLGQEFSVTLRVENTSSSSIVAEVADTVPKGLTVIKGSPSRVLTLRPGEAKSYSYRVRASKRGRYEIGPTTLQVWDEFLTRKVVKTIQNSEEVVVLPPVRRLYWLPLKRSVTFPGFGDFPSRKGGEGLEFIEVGESASGIARRVNWKATAKFDRLMVNLYSEEHSAGVLVVLDVPGRRLLGEHSDTLVEELVTAAASVAAYLHQRGHRVSLLVLGWYRDWVKPGFGKSHLLRILVSLAGVRILPNRQVVEPGELVSKVVPYLTPARSLAIVISSLVEAQGFAIAKELEKRGYHVLYLAVNPFEKIKDEKASESLSKAWLRGALSRLGGKDVWIWVSAKRQAAVAVVKKVA